MQPTAAALTEAPETRELHQPSPEAGGAGGLTPGGARRLAELEETIREARSVGALYHPTNPFDAWFPYLGLGSPQAAERWLKAHGVLIFQDRLGYNRAFVKEIDAANLRSAAETIEAPRRLREAEDLA